MDIALALHLGSTLSMTGLIWFVQIIHYPLMERVPASAFQEYEAEHVRRTGYVVAPLMLTELGTGVWLWWTRTTDPGLHVAALCLLAVVWLSTAWIQVPCHRKLEKGFDAATIQRLVRTNWIRTLAWSARGILVCLMTG